MLTTRTLLAVPLAAAALFAATPAQASPAQAVTSAQASRAQTSPAQTAIPAQATTTPTPQTPQTTQTTQTTLTCQNRGIDPTAQLHYQTETFIKAPLSTIWKLHTDVESWPAWQTAVTTVKRLDPGPLRPGSRFRWTTPAPPTPTTPATTLVITSTVQQVKPGQCIRWTGPAIGEGLRIDRGVHVWTFTPVRGGVVVRTEESWTGEQIEADPATAIQYLAPGLDAWLAALKTTAEARSSHC